MRRVVAGTTLLELMLALSLAGLVLLGASMLVDQASRTGTVLTRYARTTDAAANGERLLRALLARAQSSTDSARMFVGEPERASFDAWCERPGGWLEICRVALSLQPYDDRTVIAAALSTGEELPLRAIRGRAVFRYYGTGDSGEIGWLTAWGRSIVLPVAVGIVTDADTLVLRAGGEP
jgi:hypothetical protein